MIRKLTGLLTLAAAVAWQGAAPAWGESPALLQAEWQTSDEGLLSPSIFQVAFRQTDTPPKAGERAEPMGPGLGDGGPVVPGFNRPPEAFLREDEGYPFTPNTLQLPREHLGWFFSAETALIIPSFDNEIRSGDTLEGTFPGNPVHTPGADLDVALMPKFDFGYRYEEGLGEWRTSYRYLQTSGDSGIANFDGAGGAGTVSSDLFLHVIDIDYCWTDLHQARWPRVSLAYLIPGRGGMNMDMEAGSRVHPLQVRRSYGCRMVNMFYETAGSGGTVLNERMTNNYRGAGLHWAVNMTKAMPWHPLAMYSKFGCSGTLGMVDQTYTRTTAVASGSGEDSELLGIPTLEGEFGMAWVPDWKCQKARVTAGGVVEKWWAIGSVGPSGAELLLSGFFLRGEFGY